MAENSKIEWTDNTFNPWVGCVKVSPGCQHCYAERDMTRKGRWANTWGPAQTAERIKTSADNWRKPLAWDKRAAKEGKRIKVFCASLADVFEDNPQVLDWRSDLWDLIELTPNLDWLLLTKRPENIKKFTKRWDTWGQLPANIWLGTTVENQEQAEKRIPELLRIPAAVRFLSCEPLLGSIQLLHHLDTGDNSMELHWVIVGGESGPNARPMHPDWARSLRDQCQAAGVPFFFKQWGELLDVDLAIKMCLIDTYTDTHKIVNVDGRYYAKVGKRAAGSLLDSVEYKEFPK